MTKDATKLGNIGVMIKELLNKDTTIRWDKKANQMMFNGQDITSEVGIMIQAFQVQDAKKMGFVFADTLYEHLRKKGKTMPTLIL